MMESPNQATRSRCLKPAALYCSHGMMPPCASCAPSGCLAGRAERYRSAAAAAPRPSAIAHTCEHARAAGRAGSGFDRAGMRQSGGVGLGACDSGGLPALPYLCFVTMAGPACFGASWRSSPTIGLSMQADLPNPALSQPSIIIASPGQHRHSSY
jgi:hypothetical protein